MRRAPALAAAALLAGCTVEVDGAPCTAPGSTHECPGGQACGNNRRCSARALACAGSRCTPVSDDACLDERSGTASGSAVARRCSDVDSVCGRWEEEACVARGLRCGRRGGAAHCECPHNPTRELVVLPGGAPRDAPPFASGATSPPGCAFATLTDALASADATRYTDPAGTVTVIAAGAPANGVRAFSSASGERFPLVVPKGVVLTTDAWPAVGGYEVVFDAQSDTGAAVEVREGSTLAGFTIRNGNRDETHVAIDAKCYAPLDPAHLSSVIVEARGPGGRRLGSGLHGTLQCPVVADAVHVRDAARAGILWDPVQGTSVQLSFTRGSLRGCGTGIEVRTGRIVLDGARVEGNVGRGLDATTVGGAPWISIWNSRFVRNGDTGIAIFEPSEIDIAFTTVFGNAAQTVWGGSRVQSGIERRAGGVVFFGDPPPGRYYLSWSRIYANHGDQILVMGPSWRTWTLDTHEPLSCQGYYGANAIGCYDPEPSADAVTFRGIVAIDARVTARNQWWQRGDPSQELDVAQLPSRAAMPIDMTCPLPADRLDCESENEQGQ